ncbi:MAG: hypothetical protein NWQ13_04530, partial [Glaciimonas sp.]|nr:hypothetical protein [Glaciimonas sp.]
LLALLGDESEAALQGGTATMARLPLVFTTGDGMVKLKDEHVAAISVGTLGVLDAPENKIVTPLKSK